MVKVLPKGEVVSASNPIRYATSGPFDPSLPPSDDNPLPVAVSPATYTVGEPLSDTNRLPVVFVNDGDGAPTFSPGEPISIGNPLPIAIGTTLKAAWPRGGVPLGALPIPGYQEPLGLSSGAIKMDSGTYKMDRN